MTKELEDHLNFLYAMTRRANASADEHSQAIVAARAINQALLDAKKPVEVTSDNQTGGVTAAQVAE